MLIPCYKDMDAYELPDDFAHLQAQDMSKIGFINDVVRGIKKVINNDSHPKKLTAVKEAVVMQNENGNVRALIDRGFMALEDGEWEKADGFFEQALNFDAKIAEAYLGKLMAELKVTEKEKLSDCEQPFDNINNYQKAIRFGDEALVASLHECIAKINERNENNRLAGKSLIVLIRIREGKVEGNDVILLRPDQAFFKALNQFSRSDFNGRICCAAAVEGFAVDLSCVINSQKVAVLRFVTFLGIDFCNIGGKVGGKLLLDRFVGDTTLREVGKTYVASFVGVA